jgi:UDP-2,3-diacylglucosamine hydrolase
MALLLRLKEKNAHTIFGAIADELKKDGVELIDATPWLAPLMPGKDFQLGPKLSAEQKADVEFGFRIAKEISRLEIGQTVVVKNGAVLAVEGFEGTDKCLARGGELAGKDGGAVAVKVAKPKTTTCASTSRASARRRWKFARRAAWPCSRSNPARRFCWNAKLAKRWPWKI